MVAKITDQGLWLGWLPLPGRPRLVPFEDVLGVDFIDNGQGPRLTARLAGQPPRSLKGGSDEATRRLAAELEEVLHPAPARPGRRLSPPELQQAVTALIGHRGMRPSVLLELLLDQAQRHRATDLHLDPAGADYRVRYRIDGVLHDAVLIPEAAKARLIAHVKNAAGLASYRRDVPQEGRISHGRPGQKPVELRLSIIPSLGDESIALRLFDQLRGSLELLALGFSEPTRRGYEALIARPRGLALISGPSSSGKTTTIYASLSRLMSGPRSGQRAVSLEDPIEFPLSGVSQVEVAPHKGMTFDRLLANVLRQDAEVIVVGEIRDEATAGIALRGALTGHLILSTVHCGSAAEASRRLLNLGADPTSLAEALAGVLCQRLVRKVCPDCGRERPVSAEERERTGAPEWLATTREGPGCESCLGSGYLGRTAIAELLSVDAAIAGLIEARASAAEIGKAAGRAGFADLRRDGFDKVAAGVTSLAEIGRVV